MGDMEKDIYVHFPKNRRVIYGIPLVIYIIFIFLIFEIFTNDALDAVSTMYMKNELEYSDAEIKILTNTIMMVQCFMNIIGVVVADNWIGYYYPPLAGSIVVCVGKILMSLGPFHSLNLPQRSMFFVSLTIMYIGSAMLTLVYPVLKADQFILPDELKGLTLYYFISYYVSSSMDAIAKIVGPIVRTMHCFGEESCYPPLFLGSALAVVVYTSTVYDRNYIGHVRPQRNILGRTLNCILHAMKQFLRLRKTEKKANCLDYADDKYEQMFIDKIKTIFRIFIVVLPTAVVNTLNTQVGTSWVFTSARLDGDIGFMTVLPDQVDILSPLMVLCCLPIVKKFVYPYLERKNYLTKLLQKMAFGGSIVGVSFIVVTCLQFRLEVLDPVLPKKGEAQLRMYNSIPCDVTVKCDEFSTVIPGLDVYVNTELKIDGNKTISLTVSTDESCSEVKGSKEDSLEVKERALVGVYLGWDSSGILLDQFNDKITKITSGRAQVRHLVSADDPEKINLAYHSSSNEKRYEKSAKFKFAKALDPMEYTLKIDDNVVGKFRAKTGGIYVLLLSYKDPNTPKFNSVIVTPPNSIHMAWMIIPYFFLIIGDIFFTIAAKEFYYTQAPRKMKGVVQCIPQLKGAFSKLLIIIIEPFYEVVHSQAILYVVYTMLLYAGMGIFIFLQKRYKYVTIVTEEEEADLALLQKKQKEEASKK